MAWHGKKPSEENTSSRAPRTLAGSATTNTSADGIDAATSSSAADSSTDNGTFASNADNNTASNTDSNTGNAHTNSASHEADATEAGTNAIDTNATGTRTTVNGDTAETSDRQSLEADGAVKSNESRRLQDPFAAVIAQGISDGDAWTDQHVKRFYRQIIITVVVVVVILGAIFRFTGIRASQQMRDLTALNDCEEAVATMNTSYSKAFQPKAKISEAFTSFDKSYDLDKLAELHQTEVTAPKTLSCATDGGDGTDGTASGDNSTGDTD